MCHYCPPWPQPLDPLQNLVEARVHLVRPALEATDTQVSKPSSAGMLSSGSDTTSVEYAKRPIRTPRLSITP